MQKEKYITKTCSHHGETTFVLEGRNYYRCGQCRTNRVTEFRRKNKQKAIDYKGGCCERCGYSKCNAALEFHHLDPNEKDFGVSAKGLTRPWEKIKIEIDKCILVCSNCHKEIHNEL